MEISYTLKLVLCVCLYILCIIQPQANGKQIGGRELVSEMKLDFDLNSQQCLDQLQILFTPEKLNSLVQMTLYSGKGANQLGNFDECNMNDELEYVLLRGLVDGSPLISIGICGPKSCSSDGNYDRFADMLADALRNNQKDNEQKIEGEVVIPNAINAKKLSNGALAMISICSLIFVFMLIGLLVQYTKLGNINDTFHIASEHAKIEDNKGKLALFFYSFSPAANLEKLFTVSKNGDKRLAAINGVRVLSICWVIVGHSFSTATMTPITNIASFQNMLKEPLFGIVPGGTFAVDSFFFLSGLLSFYLLATKMYPKKGKINVGLLYFHRYYRLIFPIVFITGFLYYILPYLGDGPNYKAGVEQITKNCDKYWWSNFLFINNLYPWKMHDECTLWVWYLANDFQFFIVTPPLIFLYCKRRIIGYSSLIFMVFISMLINSVLTVQYDVSVYLTTDNDFNPSDVMYSKPWSRMSAYFVGGLIGLSYFELACKDKYPELQGTISNGIYNKLKHSKLISILSLLLGFGLTALYVFPLRNFFLDCGIAGPNCWSTFTATIYNATCRPFFAIGIALVLMPTFVGRLRLIQGILSNEPFAVLARLNYTVYLIHCGVMVWYLGDMRQGTYINWVNMWHYSIGSMIASFLFAIPFTLFCEVPFMNIEKYILFAKPKQKASNEERLTKYEPIENGKFTINASIQ